MKSNYIYSFDGYFDGFACGWILSRADIKDKVKLGVYVDQILVKEEYANIFRSDLLEAGISDGCCSFRIDIADCRGSYIELKILPTGIKIEGSELLLFNEDRSCAEILAKSFDKYTQFREQGRKRAKNKLTNINRLNNYSKEIIEWAIQTENCRDARFFPEEKNKSYFRDLYWYFFTYQGSIKKYVIDEELDIFFGSEFDGSKKNLLDSKIFLIWKAYCSNMSDLGNSRKLLFEFINAYTRCSNPLPTYVKDQIESDYLDGHNAGYADLPPLNSYLKYIYDTGYSNIYDINNYGDYVSFLYDIILHKEEIELLGRPVVNFFQQRLNLDPANSTRFAFITKNIKAKIFGKSKNNENLDKWLSETWLTNFPHHSTLVNPDHLNGENEQQEKNYIYIIANWGRSHGLTKNAEMSFEVLKHSGIPVRRIYPNGIILNEDLIIDSQKKDQRYELHSDILLFHVNADVIPGSLSDISSQINIDSNAYIIGYFLWELEDIPQAHQLGLKLVDAIWAPSIFVQNIYKKIYPEKTFYVGKSLKQPPGKISSKLLEGLDAKSFIFLNIFDFNSGIERKNPLATAHAFLMAFENEASVRLVFKSTPKIQDHWGDPFKQFEQLKHMAIQDTRIIIIEDFVSDSEIFGLINDADCIISSHRAEGFAYVPAYAILMRKQVIMTGYSGISSECSSLPNVSLIDYNLVPVPNGRFIYPLPASVWAQVNVIQLGAEMRKVFEKFKYASNDLNFKEQRRLQSFEDDYSPSRLANRYLELLTNSGTLSII